MPWKFSTVAFPNGSVTVVITTYSSFTCGNSTTFPQAISLPLSLSRSLAWIATPAWSLP
jgi:hypothetical protein